MTIEQDDENEDIDDEDCDEFDIDGSGASGIVAGSNGDGFPMCRGKEGVTTTSGGSSSCSKSVGSREGGSSYYGQSSFSTNRINLEKGRGAVSTSSTASDENVSQTISKFMLIQKNLA